MNYKNLNQDMKPLHTVTVLRTTLILTVEIMKILSKNQITLMFLNMNQVIIISFFVFELVACRTKYNLYVKE